MPTEMMQAGLSRPIRNKLLTKIHPRLSSFRPENLLFVSELFSICNIFVRSYRYLNCCTAARENICLEKTRPSHRFTAGPSL